jgi:CheY-like chemotaxis protein
MRTLPRILIVEDESAIAELIAVNLKHNGFQPIWAIDAATAQRELDDVIPDVILLDLGLPDGDGLNVTRAIRTESRTPILVLSARGQESRIRGGAWETDARATITPWARAVASEAAARRPAKVLAQAASPSRAVRILFCEQWFRMSTHLEPTDPRPETGTLREHEDGFQLSLTVVRDPAF